MLTWKPGNNPVSKTWLLKELITVLICHLHELLDLIYDDIKMEMSACGLRHCQQPDYADQVVGLTKISYGDAKWITFVRHLIHSGISDAETLYFTTGVARMKYGATSIQHGPYYRVGEQHRTDPVYFSASPLHSPESSTKPAKNVKRDSKYERGEVHGP
jgi:hypothetical protein